MLPIGLCFITNIVTLSLIYSHIGKLSPTSPTSKVASDNYTQVIERLDHIAAQLDQIQSANPPVLGATAPSAPGLISDLLPDISYDMSNGSKRFLSTSKDVSGQVKVYKEQADFSPVVGQLVPDYKYPYTTKLNNWYLVELSGDITGWVKANDVHEVL